MSDPSRRRQRAPLDARPLLYNTHQAADLLNVSYAWLKQMATARRVPHTRIGRSVRFSDAHLQEIIRAGEVVVARRPREGSSRSRL